MDRTTALNDIDAVIVILTDLKGILSTLSDDDLQTLQNIKETSTWGKIKLVGHLLTDAAAAREYFGGMLMAAKSLKLS